MVITLFMYLIGEDRVRIFSETYKGRRNRMNQAEPREILIKYLGVGEKSQ